MRYPSLPSLTLRNPDREVLLWENDFDFWDPTGEGWVDGGVGDDRSITADPTGPGLVVMTAATGNASNYARLRRGNTGLDLSQITLDMVWRLKVSKPYDATDTGTHFFGVNDSDAAIGNDTIGFQQVNGQTNWRLVTRGGAGTATFTTLSGAGVAVPSDTFQWFRIVSQPLVPAVTAYIGATFDQLAVVGTYTGAEVPAAGELCGALAFTDRDNVGSNSVSMTIDYTRGIALFPSGR